MAIQQGTAVRAEWERAVVSTLGVGDAVDGLFACSFRRVRLSGALVGPGA
jgi:hypothetical protein